VGREITRLSKEIELFFEKEMQKMEESERPLPEMKRQDMEEEVEKLEKVLKACGISTESETQTHMPAA
ncbi:MAG: hypothetical protein LBP31_01700, partial [Holosporales bacterium]|jgi:HEPN domain-containing protein|nr:hypothetical protein [Holosporales bacterium]